MARPKTTDPKKRVVIYIHESTEANWLLGAGGETSLGEYLETSMASLIDELDERDKADAARAALPPVVVDVADHSACEQTISNLRARIAALESQIAVAARGVVEAKGAAGKAVAATRAAGARGRAVLNGQPVEDDLDHSSVSSYFAGRGQCQPIERKASKREAETDSHTETQRR